MSERHRRRTSVWTAAGPALLFAAALVGCDESSATTHSAGSTTGLYGVRPVAITKDEIGKIGHDEAVRRLRALNVIVEPIDGNPANGWSVVSLEDDSDCRDDDVPLLRSIENVKSVSLCWGTIGDV